MKYEAAAQYEITIHIIRPVKGNEGRRNGKRPLLLDLLLVKRPFPAAALLLPKDIRIRGQSCYAQKQHEYGPLTGKKRGHRRDEHRRSQQL